MSDLTFKIYFKNSPSSIFRTSLYRSLRKSINSDSIVLFDIKVGANCFSSALQVRRKSGFSFIPQPSILSKNDNDYDT